MTQFQFETYGRGSAFTWKHIFSHILMNAAALAPRPVVLILEDEWVTAAYLQQILEEAGYDILGPAACVGSALQLIARRTPTFALLDICLRGERGFLLARALGERSVPFVFMTGYSTTDIPEDLRNHPTITRPIDNSRLLACVGKLLQFKIDDGSGRTPEKATNGMKDILLLPLELEVEESQTTQVFSESNTAD